MLKSHSSKTNRPYSVVEYDPNWPKLYEEYARKISPIFGENLIEINHIGSTSIPGMFAKPSIDIYVLVKDLTEVRKQYDKMRLEGFACRGDYSGISEEYFTLDTSENERIACVHVFDQSSKDRFKEYKNFRDYLIINHQERERYINLKHKLYKKYQNNYPKYDSGKKELIDELKKKANLWANNK